VYELLIFQLPNCIAIWGYISSLICSHAKFQEHSHLLTHYMKHVALKQNNEKTQVSLPEPTNISNFVSC